MTPRCFAACLFSFLLMTGCAGATNVAHAQNNNVAPRANGNADVQARSNVDLPRLPSISPDGSHVVFSWRGDLWRVAGNGGWAERITSHPADDLQSAWSRDGKRIAFASTRAGGTNFFIMNADGTGIAQVTKTDRSLALIGFGVDDDGKEVLTASAYLDNDAYRSARPYMVSTNGGTLVRVHDAFGLHPVISPDGKRVLFNRGSSGWSRRGYDGSDARDVWLFDRGDKSFKQLTSWKGNDGRARWINDDEFVYASDRADNTVNLYRLRVGEDEKNARRLTNYTDLDVEDYDVSADGRTLVFARWNRLHRLDLTSPGATPVEISIQAAEDETDRYQWKDISRTISEAAISPDGKTVAFVTYGEIYVRGTESKAPGRRVTNNMARERDIAWSADGEKLYFVSDESGMEAIHSAAVKLTRSDVKKKYEEATKKDPTTRPDTPATHPSSDETSPADPPTEPANEDSIGLSDAAVEQVRRRGQPPAAGAAPTTAPSARPASAESTTEPSRWSEALSFTIEKVSSSEVGDWSPSPSPDGKQLAFKRGKGDLYIMTLSDKSVRPFLDGWSEALDWRWSPDSRHIAYQTEDPNHNTDIWIAKSDDRSSPEHNGHPKSAVNVTRHPNNDNSPRWSADGKILLFRSERMRDEYDVWMVYLDKDIEALTATDLDQYYKDAAAAAKKRQPLKPASTTRPARGNRDATTRPADETASTTMPTTSPAVAEAISGELDLDDAYLRLRRLTSLAGNESSVEITPGGERYIFTATVGTQRGLFALDRDGSEPRRIGAAVSVRGMNFAGDQVVFVEAGRAGAIKLGGGEPEYYDIADRIRIDLEAQSTQKFHEAARILGAQYWDAKMNGLDWPAVTRQYAELARAARTSDEFDHVANRMVGLLNGSHLGINMPDPPNPQSRAFGRLGINVEPTADPLGFKIISMLPDGPADRGKMRLKLNDVITAIDLEPIKPDDTIESALAGKTDREVLITFTRDGHELAALLTPVSYDRLGDLMYNHWRRESARKVEEWSGGKLGYIHIQSMNQPSLDVFERDLYAAADGKLGLIIDVRNNGGGSTADLLLGSIMYPRHAYTIPRDMDPSIKDAYPQDRLFIQRYDRPINMLCNEKSFSNAEIIAHAFKTLKRGTLVGQTTAGGVISTGGTTLLDGTSVRIPGRAWFLPDGRNMERNGAEPNLIVPQTPEDEVKNEDKQLRAAVDDLLKRVK